MSVQHLQRYIGEFAGRHNVRDLTIAAQLADLVTHLVGKHLHRLSRTAGRRFHRGPRTSRTCKRTIESTGGQTVRCGRRCGCAGFGGIEVDNACLPEFMADYSRRSAWRRPTQEDTHRAVLHDDRSGTRLSARRGAQKVTGNLSISLQGRICRTTDPPRPGYRLRGVAATYARASTARRRFCATVASRYLRGTQVEDMLVLGAVVERSDAIERRRDQAVVPAELVHRLHADGAFRRRAPRRTRPRHRRRSRSRSCDSPWSRGANRRCHTNRARCRTRSAGPSPPAARPCPDSR